MKYRDTVACSCRYGDVAYDIFCDADIIWENSYNDWQGSAEVLAHMSNGSFAHYEWDYGSCSGCDTWEAQG